MKRLILTALIIRLIYSEANAQPGVITNEFVVEEYKTKEYQSDFKTVFSTDSDKNNFKKLREYLQKKKDILKLLQDELFLFSSAEINDGKLLSKKIKDYEKRIEGKKDQEMMTVDIYLSDQDIDYYDEITIKKIKDEILPDLRSKLQEINAQDSLYRVSVEKLRKNIDLIQQDVSVCEKQIDSSLAPEIQQQNFSIWISITFASLIGILLVVFFFLIYTKSNEAVGIQLLGESGLQFVTLFILIIVITLFGILGILEGRELAAILSGISGYILGKGITKDPNRE